MANFTAKDVNTLRQQTGVGMMECKKALVEADGDMEKAGEILRTKGLAAAQKKAGRIAAEGVITTVTEGNVSVLLEVNSETDFVAQNADFVAFVNDIAKTVLETNPSDVEELLHKTLVGSDKTVEAALQDKILVIGENLKIRRFYRAEGVLQTYLHGNSRIGVLVEFNADPSVLAKPEFTEMSKDVAMQIAAITPKYLDRSQVPTEEVENEKRVLVEQVVQEGKPENIAHKIVEGRIGKFFEQICLLDQAFVKDGHITVAEYVEQASKTLGTPVSISKFHRYEVGEGIEKKEDNFADEVASMMK